MDVTTKKMSLRLDWDKKNIGIHKILKSFVSRKKNYFFQLLPSLISGGGRALIEGWIALSTQTQTVNHHTVSFTRFIISPPSPEAVRKM